MRPRRLHSPHRRPTGERGFALLVVFLIAAGIMISLYLEIPRIAFESQRNREEMLIERGEQYSRAIEVYYRKNKRYPAKMEDLENTNNIRFLRKRYKDPLTGKDEWREVHMGPAGQLADSLVEKPGQQPGQQVAGLNGQPGAAGMTGTPVQPTATVPGMPPNPEEINVAQNRIRPSDRNPGRPIGPGVPGYDPNNPQQQQPQVDANGNPIGGDPNQQQQFQAGGNNANFQNPYAQAGLPTPQQMGPTFPGQQPTSIPGPPGVNPYGVQPGTPGQTGQNVYYQNQNGQPFSPGAQLQGQLGAQNGLNPAQAGFGNNPALNAINNQLRNPSPSFGSSGFNNNSGTTGGGFGTAVQTSQMSGGQTIGGGIAGVASKQTGVGIKRYNDRSKYKEWEFIFDYRKPKVKPTTGVGGNGLQQSNMNSSPFGSNPQQPTAPTPPTNR